MNMGAFFLIFLVSHMYPIMGVWHAAILIYFTTIIWWKIAIKEPVSPVLIIFLINLVYFSLRISFLAADPSSFAFPDNQSFESLIWLRPYAAFNLFFYLGWAVLDKKKSMLAQTPPRATAALRLDMFSKLGRLYMGISLTGFAFYFLQVGWTGIANNFSVQGYFDLGESGLLSAVKNVTIWAMFAGFLLFSSAYQTKTVKDLVLYLLVFFIALLVSSVFARRGHMMNIILIAFVALAVKKVQVKPMIVIPLAFIGGLLLYSIFIIRSHGMNEDFLYNLFSSFNSGEFWVLDQYIFVAGNIGDAIEISWGSEHISSLFFFLTPYSEFYYEKGSIGMQLIRAMYGIYNWGIPPSIYGYSIIVLGPYFGFIYAFFLGLILSYVFKRVNRLGEDSFRILWFGILVPLIWQLFRSGDPLITVYLMNRWIILVVFSVLLVNMLGRNMVKDLSRGVVRC